jgi:hypothetical protein
VSTSARTCSWSFRSVTERVEAELAVETALEHLAHDAADLEVHALEERSGLPELAVEVEGGGLGEIGVDRFGWRRRRRGLRPSEPRPAEGPQPVLGTLHRT